MKSRKDKFNNYRFALRWRGLWRCVFVFLLVSGFHSLTVAQTKAKKLLIKPLQDKVFIKEQGQFTKNARETKMAFTEPILYGVENEEFNAYFTAHGIVFQFPERRNIEEKDREQIDNEPEERSVETIWHTATMQWLNTNTSVELVAEQKVSNYYNYSDFYGGFDDKTFYNFVPAYKKIKYIDLYPGVDVEFELPEEGGIKYKFIVKPNVVIPLISFQWDGLEKISTDEKGDLHLKSKFAAQSLNSEWQLLDHAPNAFTANSHTDIPVKFIVNGNKVEFKFSSSTISSSEGIVIDPWLTPTGYPSLNRAFDIQEDSVGNIFIQGNQSNYHIEKYNSLGVLQWTYVTYSVFLGDIAVDNPGNTYIIGGYCSGKRQKLNPAGIQVWSQGGLCEEWRLAFNYSKTVLAVCGYFVNPGGNNLARLDMATGAVSDQIAYNQETRSIATDCNGDMYSLHLPSAELRKTNADFTPGGVVPSGLALIYSGTGYALNPAYSPSVFQGFNGTLIQGPYVYIYDGTLLRRFNKSTLTHINSVTVPNGVNYQCSGLSTDPCGNVYAGTTNSIVKFDSALTYMETIPTPGPVYDIILGSSGELLACGSGFLGSFSISCAAPPPLSVTVTSTNADCDGGTSSVLVSGGIAPYSYIWQPGGQTTDSIGNLTPGTYTYTVTDPFCRAYQDSIIITLIPPLVIEPGVIGVVSPGVISNESCPGALNGSATVTAFGGTGPYTFYWNTNPVQYSQTATGLAAGTYLATVVDADSCRDTLSIVITRNLNPHAAFGFTKVCYGSATQFTDSSTTASGTIISRAWDFGDGSSVNNNTSPSYIYPNPGNYVVTLIITTNFGCADTITKSVQVYYNPVASFTSNDVCLKDTVYFTNTSSVDNSTAIGSYLWKFGDLSPTSGLQNPSHYYSVAGTYSVILITTSTDLCSKSDTLSVNTFDPPSSVYTVNNTCLLDSAVFVNTSLSPTMGSTASWSWNFGDGSALNTTVWNPRHLYAVPGNYQTTLITYSSNLGCPDTLHDSITVFPMPIANFGFSNVCLNVAMVFSDLSTVSSGSIAGWSWSFGDGTPISIIQNPNHVYAIPGTYTVSLMVTTNNGCKNTVSKVVVVHALPVAKFSTSNVCDGSVVQFNDLSNILATDTILSWSWNFGDNSSVNNNQNTSHLYPAAGFYVVKLLVVSNFGCKDSVTKISIINPNPVVSFAANDTIGCEPLCISFLNSSTILSGANIKWAWVLGDGNSINNSQSFDHCYTNDSVFAANFYTVTLTVTSDSGCVSTLSKNNYITVYPNPNASFTVLPKTAVITNPVISISDLSAGANFWKWSFGDGSDTSHLSDPLPHTYADTGAYTITLITSTQFNCIDTSYQTIIIEPDFVFYIPNAFTPDGDGINDTFSGKGIFIKNYEMTIFDRWGNLIFFSDDINKPWDGKINSGSEIAPVDVYVYVVKITGFNKSKYLYRGIVTLVR
ncbi:MAG: PKD domain-containing protein [Bacteroidota bacterium]